MIAVTPKTDRRPNQCIEQTVPRAYKTNQLCVRIWSKGARELSPQSPGGRSVKAERARGRVDRAGSEQRSRELSKLAEPRRNERTPPGSQCPHKPVPTQAGARTSRCPHKPVPAQAGARTCTRVRQRPRVDHRDAVAVVPVDVLQIGRFDGRRHRFKNRAGHRHPPRTSSTREATRATWRLQPALHGPQTTNLGPLAESTPRLLSACCAMDPPSRSRRGLPDPASRALHQQIAITPADRNLPCRDMSRYQVLRCFARGQIEN